MSQHGTLRSRPPGEAAGFTLIELMVVLVVITVILVIAIPNFLGARLTTNETAAIANLRSVWNAEVQFQQSAATDVDGDGAGEFGFLREITVTITYPANGQTKSYTVTALISQYA